MGTPPVITGAGVCEYAGNNLTMTQTIAANLLLAGGNVILGPAFQSAGVITNLTLSGATLIGTNAVTGTMIWNGGIVNGPLTVKSGALLNIIGSGTLYNVLTNLGTVTITGSGAVTINNNGSTVFGGVYNLAGGRWDFQTNATVFTAGSGSEFFNNTGTVLRSGGTSSSIYVSFTNSGTVQSLVGILYFYGNFVTTGGTLAFGVSGLANIGQITVAGSVALNGTASVSWLNGFTPAVGNSFTLLNYGSHSGTFSSVSLPAGTTATTNYSATAFSLTVTGVTTQTNPVMQITFVSPNDIVSWPTSAAGYTLQTTTNLASGVWNNVSSGIVIIGGNYVLTNKASGNAAFFRLIGP